MTKISNKTMESVRHVVSGAVEKNWAKPEWLRHINDGRISLQDLHAAKKIERHVNLGAVLTGIFLGGALGGGGAALGGAVANELTAGSVEELVAVIRKGIKEQGFLATVAETCRDFGRKSVVAR